MVSLKPCTTKTTECFKNNSLIIQFEIMLHLQKKMTSDFIKKGHSTDMCIYVLKEFIEYYRSRNTSVFVTF